MANVRRIPFFWDFDKTLSVHYQQVPIFKKHFDKVRALAAKEGFDLARPEDAPDYFFTKMDCAYGVGHMVWMLRNARPGGVFAGLTNDELREFGREVTPAEGLAAGLRMMERHFEERTARFGGVEIDHHIVSVGLKPMIEGFLEKQRLTGLIPHVYASEFLTGSDGVIDDFKVNVTPFSKNEWILARTKGEYELLDKEVPQDRRRYDSRDVVVVGDGITDIAKISLAKQRGGTTFGVYIPSDDADFERAKAKIGSRVDFLVPRDFTPGSLTLEFLFDAVESKLTRTCDFSPGLLYEFMKGEIRHEGLLQFSRAHVTGCRECSESYVQTVATPSGTIERHAQR